MVRQQDPSKPRRAMLQIPRVEAAKRIEAQIERGNELLSRKIEDETELEDSYHAMYIWTDYNEELLKRIVDTDELNLLTLLTTSKLLDGIAKCISRKTVSLSRRFRRERKCEGYHW